MTRFYVAVGSDRKGPFALDELRTAVKLEPESLVWAQGMDEWTRAEQVTGLAPLLAEAASAQSQPRSSETDPPDGPPPVPAVAVREAGMREGGGGGEDFILLNPRLPRMGKAICLFALLVNPALWLVSSLSCLTFYRWDDPSPDAGAFMLLQLVLSVASLATAGLLVYGGLKLRALRRSGVTVLKAGFSADLVLLVLGIMIAIVIAVAYAGAPVEATRPPPPPPNAGDVVRWLCDAAALLAYGCEVVFLVWLIRRGHTLPLR